jgi:methyltransferase
MRSPEIIIPVASLIAVLLMMLAELIRSRVNERILRRRGAVEPRGDVYRLLALIYPAMFVLMPLEGVATGPSSPRAILAGFLVFAAAKLLKAWAISTLGARWSYRVLVLPGAALVSTGPYAWIRHPNYIAVFGEIAGFALIVGARLSGVMSLVAFGLLVRKRIIVEEAALGLATPDSRLPTPE